jgi:NAD(P)-dependent dehydrogenase (short-subunit alcohol dehydrogenase family)
VVVNYHKSAGPAEAVAQRARTEHGVRAIVVQADVAAEADIKRLFEAAKTQLGRVDIVMSNSGIEHFGNVGEVKGEDIDRVFAVNVRGQYFVAQTAYEYIENGGRVVLMSSVSGVWVSLTFSRAPMLMSLSCLTDANNVQGVPRHAIYSASKAAIMGMVKCLAWDFGPKNVTVNCVAPGGIQSDMAAAVAGDYIGPEAATLSKEQIWEHFAKMSPLKRPGMPDDIAGVVALLASPESQWLTGQTLHVGGGFHMATA